MGLLSELGPISSGKIMGSQFTDESASTIVMSGGTSGSFEFGSGTPSASSCRATIDGSDLVLSGFIAPTRVVPASNDRTSGSTSVTRNGTLGDQVTINTLKTEYAVISVSPADALVPVYVGSQAVGSFIIHNYNPNLDEAVTYSFI